MTKVISQKEFTMRFCLLSLLAALVSGCSVNEVNSRGYIISQSHQEEVPLEMEEVDLSP